MADVSKRSAKVNLTGIYGNMAFGPLGLAVMSVNGHPVNPLSDVLISGQARQTMFQPLKEQGSYEVTYNVTTGELENADTAEAQDAPLATDGVDPLDQYEEDVADFDNPPGPPPDGGEGPDDGSTRGRALYEKMKRKDIATEALKNAQDKRSQLRAQTRKQRRDTERAILESLLAGNPVIIQEPGLGRAEQIQNLREYYIDKFGGLGIRRVNPDDLRNYRRTGVSTATVEEVVGEPVINSAAAREVPDGPIPIPKNIQSMPAFVRAQDRAERIARRRERQFANLMASSQPSLQQKRQYNQDKIAAQRERLVSQSRRAERQAVRAVSEDVSNDIYNDNRLLAQVARAEDDTEALHSENSSLQSQRVQAPQAISSEIPITIQHSLVPINYERYRGNVTDRYRQELEQGRRDQLAANRMEDYTIALNAYRRGNRLVAPRDPRNDNSSTGVVYSRQFAEENQISAVDLEFHQASFHRNPQEIIEAGREQVNSILEMGRASTRANASPDLDVAYRSFVTNLIMNAIIDPNNMQGDTDVRSYQRRIENRLEAADLIDALRRDPTRFPRDRRVLTELALVLQEYQNHRNQPGVVGKSPLLQRYEDLVNVYQNLATVEDVERAHQTYRNGLLGMTDSNPQDLD
jgi:hypothetical protein